MTHFLLLFFETVKNSFASQSRESGRHNTLHLQEDNEYNGVKNSLTKFSIGCYSLSHTAHNYIFENVKSTFDRWLMVNVKMRMTLNNGK